MIELIKNGLMGVFNKLIEKPIYYEDVEDALTIILEVLRLNFWSSVEISKFVFYMTDFFDQYINLLKSLPYNKTNNELLNTLHYLTSDSRPKEDKFILFEKGVIQTMVRFLDSKNVQVQTKVIEIILNEVIAG